MNFIRFLFSKTLLVNLTIAFAITVGGVFAAIKWLDSYTLHDVGISVPDLSGFHYTEVNAFLNDKELIAVIADSINDFEKPRGVVVDQHPLPEDLVKPGRKVYVTINALVPPEVSMPELTDLTLRQAKARLQSYGLGVDSLIYKPSECSRCIIAVLYGNERIKAGTTIRKGDKVRLIVGAGPGDVLIPIPVLWGKELEEVDNDLFAMGLTVGVVRYDSTVTNAVDSAQAKVFMQLPEPGADAQINLGSDIDVFLTADSTKIPDPELLESDSLNID